MNKWFLICFLMFGILTVNAQNQINYLTLSGDSVLYSNANYKFTEFIDARTDTTKLGLLKETYDGASYQILQFPEEATKYLGEFINNVVDYNSRAKNVCVLVKQLSITEEPLGAIEIAKSNISLQFYLVENNEYKLIKSTEASFEEPGKEVSNTLSAQMERTVRLGFYDFLLEPSSEGENNKFISRKELLKREVPQKRLSTAPMGELDYVQNRFKLNGNSISKKEALKLMEQTNDAEIADLITKHKRNGAVSYVFGAAALAFIGYPIASYVGTEDEFKSTYIMFGSISIIGSLLSAKSNRYQMHKAVDLFNKRYNS